MSKLKRAAILFVAGSILCAFSVRAATNDDNNTPTEKLNDFDASVPKDIISNFPNEEISPQDLRLQFRYEDIRVPGNNGLDIVVVRRTGSDSDSRLITGFDDKSQWHIEMARVVVNKSLSTNQSFNFDCLGNAHSFNVVRN